MQADATSAVQRATGTRAISTPKRVQCAGPESARQDRDQSSLLVSYTASYAVRIGQKRVLSIFADSFRSHHERPTYIYYPAIIPGGDERDEVSEDNAAPRRRRS
jgi:hypothetical protein